MTITAVDTGSVAGGSDLQVSSLEVSGGTLYFATARAGGMVGVSTAFVPSSAASQARPLALTAAKATTGVPLTATATGGNFGLHISPPAAYLVGEVASAGTATDAAMWEFDMPDSYVAGNAVTIQAACNVVGSGTLGAGTQLQADAYLFANSGTLTHPLNAGTNTLAAGAQTISFTIPGTGIVPESHLALVLTGTIVTSSGACTLDVNGVSVQA